MYIYAIDIEGVNYVAKLLVSDGKVVWEKEDDSVAFRKRLDGSFSLNRSGNEPLFDKLLSLSFCEKGVLTVNDDTELIIQGSFRKKHLSISEDNCRIDIKFDKVDEYSCLDKISEKEFNILATSIEYPFIPVRSVKLEYGKLYEYIDCYDYITQHSNFTGDSWTNFTDVTTSPYPHAMCFPDGNFFTFFRNRYVLDGVYTPNGLNSFNVISTWVREIKLIPRLGAVQSVAPLHNPAVACDKWAWNYASIKVVNGIQYDEFVRFAQITGAFDKVIPTGGLQVTSPYIVETVLSCTETIRIFDRCRKLNDVIESMIYGCFNGGFKSEFFKSPINPMSSSDLSNLMISQKSDCISTTSDPARQGVLTFDALMNHLKEMFNVYWAIDNNGDFRIEHKKYWDNNGSYTETPMIGIDLEHMYSNVLIRGNEYSFEQKIPIRETFSFMEAWNIDFIGTDIDYSKCVDVGENISHSVSLFTTDIDPSYLDTFASKEGFCIFHCESTISPDGFYRVIKEKGILGKTDVRNAHLSWANLHNAYWKYDRFLPQGKMNGVVTDFDIRPLKYQKPISFPYCFSMFDPQKLIKTNLGNGIVKAATLSFKTNFITVELAYKDNI